MKQIAYKQGYKYQSVEEYYDNIGIEPGETLVNDYITLGASGDIVIRKGYAWDGPSGPSPDTTTNMRASLVHDALYQLMRHQMLDAEIYRLPADRLYRQMCIEDGMLPIFAHFCYFGLRLFGEKYAGSEAIKHSFVAPKGHLVITKA